MQNNTLTTDSADEFQYFLTHVRFFFSHGVSRCISALEASPNYNENDGVFMVDEDREKAMYDYISDEKAFMLGKMRESKEEKPRLDTHKLCAIFTLAVLKYQPVTVNDKNDPSKFVREFLHANELLATEICFIMLLMYQIRKMVIKENVRSYLFKNIKYSFQLPNQMHDNFDVLNGFLRSLRSIDYSMTSEKLYPTKRLIAQIYFFIDSYNEDAMRKAISDALNIYIPPPPPDKIWGAGMLPPQSKP